MTCATFTLGLFLFLLIVVFFVSFSFVQVTFNRFFDRTCSLLFVVAVSPLGHRVYHNYYIPLEQLSYQALKSLSDNGRKSPFSCQLRNKK